PDFSFQRVIWWYSQVGPLITLEIRAGVQTIEIPGLVCHIPTQLKRSELWQCRCTSSSFSREAGYGRQRHQAA
ncbi:MAG: hypothetical protein JRN15_08375, partial [Nitrososphaerota archaeon]|nr:hypothetical protein [Nitrososphaerota archaeon]